MTDVIGKPHGPHRGVIEVRGASTFDEAVEVAVKQIDAFVGDHQFALSSHAAPTVVESQDGTAHVVVWDVSFDWQIIPAASAT